MTIGVDSDLPETFAYPEAKEKAAKYEKLFEQVLKYDKVNTYTNLPKAQVIEVLDLLQSKSDHFERTKKPGDTLSIAIVNVGHRLDTRFAKHVEIYRSLGYSEPKTSTDGSEYLYRWSVTHLGQPICLPEYAARIASSVSTHVV